MIMQMRVVVQGAGFRCRQLGTETPWHPRNPTYVGPLFSTISFSTVSSYICYLHCHFRRAMHILCPTSFLNVSLQFLSRFVVHNQTFKPFNYQFSDFFHQHCIESNMYSTFVLQSLYDVASYLMISTHIPTFDKYDALLSPITSEQKLDYKENKKMYCKRLEQKTISLVRTAPHCNTSN